ncbi:MAG: ATP-binding protein [Candidatus Eremiobacteraeota bacterium]|nr:ATP-binding protein [Candidatus Eremiobacteraeota bacterium]
MHALICSGLHDWVEWRFGEAMLKDLRFYNPTFRKERTGSIPDKDLFSDLDLLSRLSAQARSSLLEDFGRYMAIPLMFEYRALIPAEWTALDVVEHTEPCIHTAIRDADEGTPPFIRCWRTPENAVRIMYNSSRRICEFARGLIRGIGDHYKEDLVIDQTLCMNRGDEYCELFVRSTTPLALEDTTDSIRRLRLHPSIVNEAVDMVKRQLMSASIDSDTIDALVLSTMEAVGNVVRHARSPDCELAVHVQGNLVKLQVTDYGPGFTLTHRAMPDPFAEGGRGIALMQSACDSVDYEMRRSGNCLTLLKRHTAH